MRIVNKDVGSNFHIDQTIEAGITLLGAEVKSIRQGRVTLKGSYARLIGDELFLVNAQIEPYPYARPEGYDPKRSRKLLVHRSEIINLQQKLNQGNYTLVPHALYFKHGLVKVSVVLVRGKKKYEKKELIKKREQKRELERNFRGKVR